MKRCINLDWLEVFVLEKKGHSYNPDTFRRAGYHVIERDYGTRQYRQMFTLCVGDIPLYEIRRDPLSKKSNGGIMADLASHIRFVNRTCYERDPVRNFITFLNTYSYSVKNISRVDLALDFQVFDTGEKPEDFVRRYMEGEVSKIHQSQLHSYGLEKNLPDKTEEGWVVCAHGRDAWNARVWNSLKWGAPTSSISTKLYNKSLELARESHGKPYIEDAWKVCGFTQDLPVWRIEFSILSGKRHMVEKDSRQLVEITLESLADRGQIMVVWESFFSEYFDFRIVQYDSKGNAIRKDRCPQKDFFYYDNHEEVYEPLTLTKMQDADRTDKIVINRLRQIIRESENDQISMVESCAEIIKWLYHKRRKTGVSREELLEHARKIDEMRSNQPLSLRAYTDHLVAERERALRAKPKAVQ